MSGDCKEDVFSKEDCLKSLYVPEVILVEEEGELCKRLTTHLSLDAKQIVLNVYKGLASQLSPTEALRMTIFLTKVPRTTVRRFVSEDLKPRKKRRDAGATRVIQSSHVELIRETIDNMLSENVALNSGTLLCELQKKHILNQECSKTTLQRFLKAHGLSLDRFIQKKKNS